MPRKCRGYVKPLGSPETCTYLPEGVAEATGLRKMAWWAIVVPLRMDGLSIEKARVDGPFV